MTPAMAGAVRKNASRQGPRLAALRERIGVVRQRRAATRRLAAVATAGLAVLVAVLAAFLLDWLLGLSRGGRIVLLGAVAAALAWALWRFVRPWLAVRESDLDLAMIVEREHGVDSDLVAALQFESADAASWGSTDLQGAVIDYVAEYGGDWQVPQHVAGAAVRSRLTWLAAGVAALLLAAAVRPDFAKAFVNRMLLGTMHYPTRTRIESLVIGATEIDLAHVTRTPVKSPLGQPLDFRIGLGGVLPEAASLRLVDASAGQETLIDLVAADGGRTFAGRLPRLLDTVRAEVFAGDAWTEPVEVRVVPLPIVELALSAETPAYARGATDTDQAAALGTRQLSVVEGSRVSLGVSSPNKRLASATLVVADQRYPLKREADAWVLAGDGAPLASVREPVQFEVEVKDEDGLAPEAPVSGSIRIRPDAAPQVATELPARLALPDGKPRVEWRVADDLGIRTAELVLEPVRAAAVAGDSVEPVTVTLLPANAAGYVGRDRLPLSGATSLPLAGLKLRKGDQVKITLRATDYRGDLEGRTAVSDPVMLDVTDEPGLLAAISESDQLSARQIDAILERQLQVGAAPAGLGGGKSGGDAPPPREGPAP